MKTQRITMDCFFTCLRARGLLIAFFALVGAIIGAFGGLVIGCLVVGGTLGAAGGPAGATGITISCMAVELTALLPWVIGLALLGAIAGAAVGLVVVASICAA